MKEKANYPLPKIDHFLAFRPKAKKVTYGFFGVFDGWFQCFQLFSLFFNAWISLEVLIKILTNFEFFTSSVSPELLHGFARGLAPVAFLRNITLLSINMKVIWRASLPKNSKQANQDNNSLEIEEVFEKKPGGHTHTHMYPIHIAKPECFLLNQGDL